MNNTQFKFDELIIKKDEIINDINNNIDGKTLLIKFKDFCNCCYSLKEWSGVSLNDLSFSSFIDICRGVINGDKHVKIINNINSYKSKYYRTNINGIYPTIQSSTGGYIGDDKNPLYTNPGKDKLIVETETKTYRIFDIIINSINDWEKILKSKGLI